ncbi:uncharacterized protein LOC130950064 [Arachis stenosperma]|uniref:uncharacterized protein LOC130950064 n=1 Tax=Arachis stenosperma TaxID=217475 RepID=UPI0025AB86CF|nr:uncharacterized protein LOC130950064 [Arachis stenosperma]
MDHTGQIESQDADNGLNGENVLVEEAEAMDSSAANADIDQEAAVSIVDWIGSFGAIEFSALIEYNHIKGFSVRRSKVGRRTKQGAEDEIIWHIFVYSREGERDGKHMQRGDRKMDPRPITRCGCEVQITVHVDDTKKQRRAGATDAEAALKFLGILRTTDCGMFWKYSLDGDKRLENLFWWDGTSRYDYIVFGDVLDFDATYGRNKYKCHLVIFSGVDHHMRTVVFGCAILSNESEGRYV